MPSASAERRHTGAEQGRGASTGAAECTGASARQSGSVAVRLPSIGSGGIGSCGIRAAARKNSEGGAEGRGGRVGGAVTVRGGGRCGSSAVGWPSVKRRLVRSARRAAVCTAWSCRGVGGRGGRVGGAVTVRGGGRCGRRRAPDRRRWAPSRCVSRRLARAARAREAFVRQRGRTQKAARKDVGVASGAR